MEPTPKQIYQEDPEYNRYPYESPCDACGKIITVLTQADVMPEYYTSLAVKCACGGMAYFHLPVN